MNQDRVRALGAYADEFIALRRDIHRYPELAYQETRTSDLVARRLQDWGYEIGRGLGKTGVVGRLRRGSGSRRLGLRADMDALPIHEATGLPYASSHDGVMHACGHDGHTTMLLAAARYLAEHGQFSGTLNLVFQPAEEGGGGALKMVEDGLFEKYPCDAIFGMHNMPGHVPGRLLFREGSTLASVDHVAITIEGVGGHGAMPHRASDPVVAAASIVMALQTIVARNVDPEATAVITVGALHAGQAFNVIPQKAELSVSVRALDRDVRSLLLGRIREIATAQAESFGVRAAFAYPASCPVLVNTPAETDFARAVAVELLGEDRITRQVPPITGSEDFAFMLERVPGSYLFIGNGDGEHGSPCMVHNPGFDFNDDNIVVGAAYWTLLAERFLADTTR